MGPATESGRPYGILRAVAVYRAAGGFWAVRISFKP